MRISADPSDPDYWKFYYDDIEVLLNGRPMRYVDEADTDYGYIICPRTTPDGRLVIEGEYVARDVTYGHVTLTGCPRGTCRYRTRPASVPSIDRSALIAMEAASCRYAISRVGYIAGE